MLFGLMAILLGLLIAGAEPQSTIGGQNVEIANACADGNRFYSNHEYVRAEAILRAAVARSEGLGRSDSVRAGCLIQLAATQTKEHKYTEAEGAARLAVNLFEQSGAGKLELGFSLGILADVLEDQQKYPEAIAVVERSWALETGHKKGDALQYRDSRFAKRLGLLHMKNKQFAVAEQLLAQNLALSDEPQIKYHGQIVPALNDLAAVYIAESKWKEAELLLRRALTLSDQWPSEIAQEDQVSALDEYADLLRKTNRDKVAEQFASRAKSVRESRGSAPQ